jgi:L-ascorbate metabolism protein UlaG (beta-lactamase superfamily)
MIDRIEWLGHASFRLNGCPLIYIDPWRVTRSEQPADIILITHDHYDHCSPADVEKLRGPNTVVIANEMAASVIGEVSVLRPWQVMNVGRASIKAVPAYNSHHPQSFGGLGFVISLDLYDIYYAGDTDVIPEMPGIRCDIAILPIGGRQTMNATHAAEAVRMLRPRWAIPSHWGSPSEGGTLVDVREFRQGAESTAQVVVPERAR